MDREAINQKLKKFYEFNDDDLNVNRSGRLMQKQMSGIQDRSKMIGMVGYGFGVFMIAVALLPSVLDRAFRGERRKSMNSALPK